MSRFFSSAFVVDIVVVCVVVVGAGCRGDVDGKVDGDIVGIVIVAADVSIVV